MRPARVHPSRCESRHKSITALATRPLPPRATGARRGRGRAGDVQAGKRVVVGLEFATFFDWAHRDTLMARLGKRIDDAGVLCLVRAYLNTGIVEDVVVAERQRARHKAGR